jgi:Skp family chaperone for outer membrane proteins
MMNIFRSSILIGLSALGLAATTATAFADEHRQGPGAGFAQAERPAPTAEQAAAFAAHMQAMIAKKQAQLHDKLALLPNQEPAWTTFIASLALPTPPDAATRAAMRAAWEKLTAPERAQKMIDQLKVHETELGTRLVALKAFYAQLTPAQQKLFDDNAHWLAHGHGGPFGPGNLGPDNFRHGN